MMVLLNDALLPNLVQTGEGAPAIVHCGPFANIAHGTSSVLAQRMGLHLADYVVNETGFAADLGAEKFFDIVMPMCGHVPSVAVVIVTLKALRAQGGGARRPRWRAGSRTWSGISPTCGAGAPSRSSRSTASPATPRTICSAVLDYCASLGVEAALSEGYAKGGDGHGGSGATRSSPPPTAPTPSKVKPLYGPRACRSSRRSPRSRPRSTAPRAWPFKPGGQARLQQFAALGYGHLPVCIAKTQYSFTDDPR